MSALLVVLMATRTKVAYRPDFLTGTRDVRFIRVRDIYGHHEVVVVWSPEVLRVLLGPFAEWHDEADHCRTWTNGAGCRCEVEP